MKKISDKTKVEIAKILELLRSAGQIHIRGIARALQIHPRTVERILHNYLNAYVDVKKIEQFGFRASVVSFKHGKEAMQLNDVLKYLELKKRIKGSTTHEKQVSTSNKGVYIEKKAAYEFIR